MFRSEMAAHPITSNLTHRCVEALLSPDREMYLARILRELVPANYMSTPLGRVGECDLEKLIVQIIVNDLRPPPKEALFLCRQTSWAVVRALVQLMSVDGFAVFGTCDVSMETDGNASVTLKHTNSSAITSPICLCHSTGLIWFQIPSDYSRPFQWLVNNLSLKVSKLFFQPQNEGERCSGQMPNAKQVFKSKCNSSSMVFGTDAVHSYNLLSAMCHKCVSLTAAASDLDSNVTEGDCSFSSTCNCVEITDSDVQEIKRETKIEHEESSGSAMADPEEDSIVAVCEKHFNDVKRTRFQFNGSERMLIVQCPGCPAEFRGLKDRMCRLVRHIQTHGPKLCELYMKVIAKRYRPVFDIMKKRINFQKNYG